MNKIILFVALLNISNLTNAKGIEHDTYQVEEFQELSHYYFAAARTGNLEVLEMYLTHQFPVDLPNNQSYTALMLAAYNGHTDSVKTLLAHGANACTKDKRGNTALMGALFKAEFSIARLLYGQSCEESVVNNAGQSLEEFAAMFGQTDFIVSLQEQS